MLFAASQQYGFPLEDSTRRVAAGRWHRGPHPHRGGPSPSLLDGDERFLRVVHDELELTHRFVRSSRRTGLGSTSSSRPRSSSRSSGRPAAHSTSSSRRDVRPPASRFRHDPAGRSDGLPCGRRPEFDSALWRLAVAARATSSFPVAFEGTFVRSTRADSYAIRRVARRWPVPRRHARRVQRAQHGRRVDPHRSTSHDRATSSSPTAASSTTSRSARRSRRSSELPPIGRRPATSSTSTPGRPTGSSERRVAAAQSDPGRAAAMRRSTVGVLAVRSRRTTRRKRSATTSPPSRHTTSGLPGRRSSARAHLRRFPMPRRRCGTSPDARTQRLPSPTSARGRHTDRTPPRRPTRQSRRGSLPEPRQGSTPMDSWRSPIARWPAAAREQLTARLVQAFGSRIAQRRPADALTDRARSVVATGIGSFSRITQLLIEWSRYIESRIDRRREGPRRQGEGAAVRGRRVHRRRLRAPASPRLGRPRDHLGRCERQGWVAATIEALDRPRDHRRVDRPCHCAGAARRRRCG